MASQVVVDNFFPSVLLLFSTARGKIVVGGWGVARRRGAEHDDNLRLTLTFVCGATNEAGVGVVVALKQAHSNHYNYRACLGAGAASSARAIVGCRKARRYLKSNTTDDDFRSGAHYSDVPIGLDGDLDATTRTGVVPTLGLRAAIFVHPAGLV